MNHKAEPNPNPAWLEIRLSAPGPQAEAAADFLTSLTGRGVQLEDPGPGGGPGVVRAFVEVGPELPAQRAAIERYARQLGQTCPQDRVELVFGELPDEDWGGAWRRYFHPRLVSRRIIVAPPWEAASPQGGQVVLVIDPGQAFGTGQHPSTQLVLRRIERLAQHGRLPAEVLDVGCGSGILGLAALKFGARRVRGIDLDPEAMTASRANAAANGLAGGLEVSLTPLEELAGAYPLVLANLTAKDLAELAAPLAARLAPGGELVVSGLLVEQIAMVRESFARQGLTLVEQDSLAGWAALVLA